MMSFEQTKKELNENLKIAKEIGVLSANYYDILEETIDDWCGTSTPVLPIPNPWNPMMVEVIRIKANSD